MASTPCIAGVAQTDFGKFRDRSLKSLAVDAGVAALCDAGVDRATV